MPSLYVDGDLMAVIREKRDELERRAEEHNGGEIYVPEKDALEHLLSDEAQRRLERERN